MKQQPSSSPTDHYPVYQFEEYLPESIRSWVDSKLRDLRIILIENGILADPTSADAPESKAVSDAKS